MKTDLQWPLSRDDVARAIKDAGVDVRKASIREMNNLVGSIERSFDVRFIRMEFGIPGLPTPPIAIEAEAEALRNGVGNVYAPFEGIPDLKNEASRFVREFMGLDRAPRVCIPTVGAMQGCYASLNLVSRMHPERTTILCLQPGFPVNRLQLRMLGTPAAGIDFYDHRGDDLVQAIERRARQGDLCGLLWSSPNNPSWINLDESELEGIARVCDEYDLVAIEDLAYFGMDTRTDYLTPGSPPYQPTILRHTDRAICVLSSSKIFSYAGQRIALSILSESLADRRCPGLVDRFGSDNVGHAFQHGGLYPVTASVPQSPQYGLTALLRAANDGDASLWEPAREYARRAATMKQMFADAGFTLVYGRDLDRPIGDGFYFTVAHPAFDHGADLIHRLLHYGVSAITLESTGSTRVEGLRACVSLTGPERFEELEQRLGLFRADHG